MERMKKQGAGWPPVSCVLAVLLVLVLESASVGAAPVSISLSEGNGDLILTNGIHAVKSLQIMPKTLLYLATYFTFCSILYQLCD